MARIDDLLEAHASRWREDVDRDRPCLPSTGGTATSPKHDRRRTTAVATMGVAAAITAAVATVVLANDGSQHPIAQNTNPVPVQSSARPTRQSGVAPTQGPSPSEPASGYCGNVANEAQARDIVLGGIATALIRARVTGPRNAPRVASYRVVAGFLDGPPRRIENLAAPPGRYLLLLGGDGSYTALGAYGVYHLRGSHAYQQCAYVGVTHYNPPERTRGGITDAHRLIALFRAALRHHR
jgi:hypothetical protein